MLVALPPSHQMYRERSEVFLPTVRLLQQLVAAHRPTKVRGGVLNQPFWRNNTCQHLAHLDFFFLWGKRWQAL